MKTGDQSKVGLSRMSSQQEKGTLYKILLVLCMAHFSLMTYKNFTDSRVELSDVEVEDLFRSAVMTFKKIAELTQAMSEVRKQQRRRALQDYGLIHGLLSTILRATASDDDVFDSGASADQEAGDSSAHPICSGRNASADPHYGDAIALGKTLIKEIEGLTERYLAKIRSTNRDRTYSGDIYELSEKEFLTISNSQNYGALQDALHNDVRTAPLFRLASRRASRDITFTRLAAEFELHLNLTLHPPFCPDYKVLLCDFRQNDVISQVHSVVYCMALALSSGRAPVLKPKWPWRACARDEIDADSLQFDSSSDPRAAAAAVADLHKAVPVAVDAEKGRFPVWTPPLSEILENRILNRVRLLHPEPEVWAVGHMVRHVLDQLINRGRLAREQKTINFKPPIAGVYIGQTVNADQSLAGHLSHVQRFFQDNFKSLPASLRRVLLVSRDAASFQEARRFAQNFTILHRVNKVPREPASVTEVYDLSLLSRCHYLVCDLTLAPCKTAFELMNSVQGDVTGRFHGMGGQWRF